MSYDSPSAAGIPERFRDPKRRWTGFAARARCYIVNTDLVDPAGESTLILKIEAALQDATVTSTFYRCGANVHDMAP